MPDGARGTLSVTSAMPWGLRPALPAKITSVIDRPRSALGALLAQHPVDGVADVGLPAAVGANHGGDSRGELHLGPIAKRFEARDGELVEMQHVDSLVPDALVRRGSPRVPLSVWTASQDVVLRCQATTTTSWGARAGDSARSQPGILRANKNVRGSSRGFVKASVPGKRAAEWRRGG